MFLLYTSLWSEDSFTVVSNPNLSMVEMKNMIGYIRLHSQPITLTHSFSLLLLN